MSLLGALAQYGLVQSRIDVLSHDDSNRIADLTLLMTQADGLRRGIIELEPRNLQEAVEKLACVINLMRREAQTLGCEAEFDEFLRAAERAVEGIATPAAEFGAANSETPGITRGGPTLFGGSVADYVAFAAGRVSLVDTSYRYVATSEENARFYGRRQVALMGAHVADVIGEVRFRSRAKARLDACFAGAPQCYHFALPCSDGGRIMRCEMKPVNSGESAILGALVYVTDVTTQIRRGDPEYRPALRSTCSGS